MLAVKSFSEVMGEWAEVFMHRSFRDFKRFMDEAGLSPSQANALMRLYHGGLVRCQRYRRASEDYQRGCQPDGGAVSADGPVGAQ